MKNSEEARNRRSLSGQVISGLAWLLAGTGGQMACRTIVLVILSRLLGPEDFGLVAASLVLINFAETISHMGIGPAITQRPDLTDEHVRTAFSFSLIVGMLCFMGTKRYSPLLASLLNMNELQPVLYVVSAIFPLRSLGLVAEALMIRDLRFRSITLIELLSYGIGYGLVGIILALLGHGRWALVYATLAQVGLRSMLLVVAHAHLKKPLLNLRALRELLVFGGGFTLARVANTLALQGDNFVIGRWLGPAALGVYGRAYQLMVTPASLFGTVLDKVLFPAMAKVQHDRVRLALSYRRGVAVIAVMVLPASLVLYILAPEVVSLVLGPTWADVVVPFRILVLGTLFRTSYKVSDSIARATGAVYSRAWRQAVYAIAVLLGAWVGQHWGLSGVSAGVTIAVMCNFVLMAQLSLTLASVSWRDFISVHVPPALLVFALMPLLFPLASVLRLWQVGTSAIVILVILAAVCLALWLTIRYPRLFIGPDGIWVVEVLVGYMPQPLQRLIRLSRVARSARKLVG